MKLPKLLIVISSLLYIIPVNAQKLKSKTVNFKHIQLPEYPLSEGFQTYSVRVFGGNIARSSISVERYAKRITMDGFKRMEGTGNNYGHLRVSINTGTGYNGKAVAKSTSTTTEDKNGNKKKVYQYFYEIPFYATTSYKIVDPDGKVISTDEFKYNQTQKTASYSTSKARRDNYSSSLSSATASFATYCIENILTQTQKNLKNNYDYSISTNSFPFYYTKKHNTEKLSMEYFNLVKEKFSEKGIAYVSAASLRETFSDAISFWEKHAMEDDYLNDNKLERLWKGMNINLAVIYFYLDDLKKSEAYANRVLNSEGNQKNAACKSILKLLKDTRNRMRENDITSVHHKRDLSNARPPAKVAAFEEEKASIESENDMLDGIIWMGGKEISGKIACQKEAKQMRFGPEGNTKFVTTDQGKVKEFELDDPNINAFNIGKREFIKLPFTPCAKGETEEKTCIMEKVYSSNKITLFQYFPSSSVLADEKIEFAYQKNEEKNPISLFATQFLIANKGLAKYFEDCVDLSEMAATGNFKINKDDLIKAARIYAELCEN